MVVCLVQMFDDFEVELFVGWDVAASGAQQGQVDFLVSDVDGEGCVVGVAVEVAREVHGEGE